MSVAVYLRVSTGEQTVDNQLPELRSIVERLNLGSPRRYDDAAVSGAKMRRPGFDALMADARAGRLGAVVVWSLDRLGRSMLGVLNAVAELDALGVRVVSAKEPWLDTGSPVRGLLLAIFAWVAEQERSRLVERTVAGLARARAEGKRLGRPPAPHGALVAAALDIGRGASVADAAKAARLSPSTLRRWLRQKGTAEPGG